MVVPMMVPSSNEAVGTPTSKEETVALQVIKMDSNKKQTGMGVGGEIEIVEPC